MADLKKVIEKATEFEKNQPIALAKEFIDVKETIESIEIPEIPEQDNSDIVEAIKELKIEKPDNTNLEKIMQKIADKKDPEAKDIKFPKSMDVNVKNQKEFPSVQKVEMSEPKWYNKFNYETILTGIKSIFEKPIKIETDDTLKVNILDSKGEVVNDFASKVGGGSSITKYILNVLGNIINPATEEKQDTANTILTSLASTVTNAIEEVDYDLNASAFSQTTNISNNYKFDNVIFNFSTEEERTITVTASNGTVLTQVTNTAKNFAIIDGRHFKGGDNITIAITQLSIAGTVSVTMVIVQGSQILTGNPVLGSGNNTIGFVGFKDSTGSELFLESNGGAPVNIQDQHTQIIDLRAHKELANFTVITNRAIDDTVFDINSPALAPIVGHLVCMNEISAFYQAHILAVVSLGSDNYTITMDTPLDFAYTTASINCLSTHNMAVDGSVTPQIFEISPEDLQDGERWDITRIIMVAVGPGVQPGNIAPDDGDFLTSNAITNGLVIREVNGTTKNIFNVKTNGDLRLRSYDVEYIPKARTNLFAVGIRRSFNGQDKNGVTIRLNSTTNDQIQAIIQDDLTDMTDISIVVQGHVVTD